MKKYICIFYILFSFFSVFAYEAHYKNLSKIEMDVLRNDKVIGYSNYFFKHDEDSMTVENYTKFIVEMFGVKVFSIDSKSKEIYILTVRLIRNYREIKLCSQALKLINDFRFILRFDKVLLDF